MNPLANIFKRIRDYFMKDTPSNAPDTSGMTILRGDGTWPWNAWIDGDDIVVMDCRATCFGGANDPQDSGETASGISTKLNPGIIGCALPLAYRGTSSALVKALGGSPLPKIPWRTKVEITSNGKTITASLIDLGPAKKTGNAIDLTIAAARMFDRKATATRFAMECSYRIKGAAKYARGTHA